MNFVSELLRSFEYFGLKKFYLKNKLENFHETKLNDIYDFQLVDGFSITECDSFLLVSENKLLSDQKGDMVHSECKTEDNTQLIHTREEYNCSFKKGMLKLRTPRLSCRFRKSTKNKFKTKINNTICTNETDILINRKNDYDETGSIFEFKHKETDSNLCKTPRTGDNNPLQTTKYEKCYFTPSNYKLKNKMFFGGDFSNSEILLLLRIERKKLALLESQLRKDLDLLEKSKSNVNNKVADENIIISNLINCPAQLYFIKHRIDNTKEIIEDMEKDIAILEEKISETY